MVLTYFLVSGIPVTAALDTDTEQTRFLTNL